MVNPLWNAGRLFANRVAKVYSAGNSIEDISRACDALHARGLSTTLSYWDSDTDSPSKIATAYIQLLDLMSGFDRESYLSVKAPSLTFDEILIRDLAARCQGAGAVLHFDSLAPETTSLTLTLISNLRKSYRHIGLTLPARWRRSLKDANAVLDMGLHVRIVEGKWPDDPEREIDPADGFMQLADRLAGSGNHVAVATSNPAVATEALSRLLSSGTTCELELQYGNVHRNMLQVAQDLDVPTRIYVPFGRAWLPYRIRTAPRNPRVLFWFFRDMIRSV